MEKWRRHEQALQTEKAKNIKRPRAQKPTGYSPKLKRYEKHLFELIKHRAILKRDHANALKALVKAYNTPDIRIEYETEIFALAQELGLSRREFERRATPPTQYTQKSFALIPAH